MQILLMIFFFGQYAKGNYISGEYTIVFPITLLDSLTLAYLSQHISSNPKNKS
jgi:hypothetical protein